MQQASSPSATQLKHPIVQPMFAWLLTVKLADPQNITLKTDVAAHIYSPRIWEMEARESGIKGQP